MRVECGNCGRVVEVKGLPAVCPFCERRIGASIAAPLAARPRDTTPAPIVGQVDHLSSPDQAPHFDPPAPSLHWQKPALVAACVLLAALALFLIVAGVRTGIKRLTASFQQQPAGSTGTSGAVGTGTTVLGSRGPGALGQPSPTTSQAPAAAAELPPPTQLIPVRADTTAQAALTDHRINVAMERGASYLIAQITRGPLAAPVLDDRQQGEHAAAVLALLYAGQSTFDQRLSLSNPVMSAEVERLKSFPMDGNYATYCRSLRTAALAMHDRKEDRRVLLADLRWLIETGDQGRYTYNGTSKALKPKGADPWDNSNSQYAVLGVWAAAEAGLNVPREFWQSVEQHWLSDQRPTGGWGYAPAKKSTTLTMTCAGINMLFVARDQLRAGQSMGRPADTAYPPEIQRALDWLSNDSWSVQMKPGVHQGYALYGLERAGLASGLRRFGAYDWYRTLAQGVLNSQLEDGSWRGVDEFVVETAFRVMFLARGRHPILMSKLQFDGAWNNRPRDLARLSEYVVQSIERPINWQVVSLKEDWSDWMDAPVLYIASHEPLPFTDREIDKLRSYALAGGLLFTEADVGSDSFTSYVQSELVPRLFPELSLAELPQDHSIYSSLYPMREKPPLLGVGNGSRLLLIHAPSDLAGRWQFQSPQRAEAAFQLGANIFTYATGKHALRHRLDTPIVPEPSGQPMATVGVGRLRYEGSWDPEPYAWTRMARWFQTETSIRLEVRPVDAVQLDRRATPLIHITGTAPWTVPDDQVDALRSYVAEGGVLFVDVTGGNQETAAQVRQTLMDMFPLAPAPVALPADHPILTGSGQGMTPLDGPGLRAYAVTVLGRDIPPLQITQFERGAILFSHLDLTSGLLDTTTWGIVGHQPVYCQQLVRNLILWTVNERGMPGAWTLHGAPAKP